TRGGGFGFVGTPPALGEPCIHSALRAYPGRAGLGMTQQHTRSHLQVSSRDQGSVRPARTRAGTRPPGRPRPALWTRPAAPAGLLRGGSASTSGRGSLGSRPAARPAPAAPPPARRPDWRRRSGSTPTSHAARTRWSAMPTRTAQGRRRRRRPAHTAARCRRGRGRRARSGPGRLAADPGSRPRVPGSSALQQTRGQVPHRLLVAGQLLVERGPDVRDRRVLDRPVLEDVAQRPLAFTLVWADLGDRAAQVPAHVVADRARVV